MDGKENLIPFNERTEEEQREIARKGGIASGEARRRKRDLKNTFDLLLSKPFIPSTKGGKKVVKELEKMGINVDEIDNQTIMAYSIFSTAINGGRNDVKAFEAIRDTVEGKPVNKIEADLNTDINIIID